MSADYSLFALAPINVQGRGEVAPKGYVTPAQRDQMEAQKGRGENSTEDAQLPHLAPYPHDTPT